MVLCNANIVLIIILAAIISVIINNIITKPITKLLDITNEYVIVSIEAIVAILCMLLFITELLRLYIYLFL